MHEMAVFVGPRGFRHVWEISQFMDLPHFKSTFITAESYNPFSADAKYQSAKVRRIVPDFLAQIFVRKPYGPVSLVDFKLNDTPNCDIINAIELYSFISRHFIAEARRKSARLSVSSWETIRKTPLFYSPPYMFNVRSVLKHSDLFLVPTYLAANCLLSLGVRSEKVKVVYPGIDLNQFGLKTDGHEVFRILFVGRFDTEKGIHILLNSFLKLHSVHSAVELWLCGPTRTGQPFVSEVQELARKYPIKLLGEIPRKEIPSIYAQCDVFCLPSLDRKKWGIKIWEEQFGWSLVEAMASGLPIVASDCGAIREVIGDHNIIVRQNSVQDLFAALLKLAEDNDYRISIGYLNRKKAEKSYDLQKQRLELDLRLVETIEHG